MRWKLAIIVSIWVLAIIFFAWPQRITAQVNACGGVSSIAACRQTFATVASLPTCSANNQGAMYMVNDATTPTALATVAGSGAVHVGVTCNGANWIVE